MTFLLEKNVFEATKKIILGEAERHPFLIDLSDWLMSTYSIKILNAQFGETPDRFFIVIESTEDYQKMLIHPFDSFRQKNNPEQETVIINKIKELGRKYNYASESRLRDIFIKYNDFSLEAKADVNARAIEEARSSITSKYPTVWHVDIAFYESVVFYYSDIDIAMNMENGLSEAIEENYFLILKKYDEINFVTKHNLNLKVDSKENVDKNFQGNLFYYFR